ncbi:oligosaccharide flippase family protein [Sphingomonas sp. TDK1]|uniref:oligosaccharide flippase family protein n=1 Tax=Sphingomonas sp. TDK1 TaxID=453247 RepID=UPI002FC313C1
MLAIAWLFLSTFNFLDFGVTRATQYSVAANVDRDPARTANIVFTALTLCVPMSLIGFGMIFGAISYFFSGKFNGSASLQAEIASSAYVIAACWPLVLFSAVINGALLGRRLFVLVNVSTTASSVLFQVVPLIAAYAAGPQLRNLLIAAFIGRALPMLGLLPALKRNILQRFVVRFSRREAGMLLGYGRWASLTTIVATALTMADRLIIAAVLGPVAVTIYTAPLQLAQRVSLLPAALSSALFPHLPTAGPDEKHSMQVRALQLILSSLTLAIGGGLLITAPFLDLWLGKSIGGAATPSALLLFFGAWWTALAVIPFSGLQATGDPKGSAMIQLAELVPFVAGLYLAAHYGGVAACAGVYLVRAAADFALLGWRGELLSDTAKGVGICAVTLTIAALIGALYRISFPAWTAATIVWSFAIAFCAWRILPRTDQRLLASLVARLVRRRNVP